jgi:hypothetical protein
MKKTVRSTTMQHALDACVAAGGLWRWPGGWWVAEPCPDVKRVVVPKAPNWSAQTIRALVDRQLLVVTGRGPGPAGPNSGFWIEVKYVLDAGRVAAPGGST